MQLKAAAEYSTLTSTSSGVSGHTATNNTPSRRSHREQGEKRFQCMQCSKKFPTSKDLKRHDVVHTGNREFQCSFCSHRFGRKDHRMRHEKKTHANELLNGGGSSSSTGSPISPKTDSNCSSNSSNNHTPVFGAKHHRLASASEELPRLGSH